MSDELIVSGSGMLHFPSYVRDGATLAVVENGGVLPFPLRRVFYITNLESAKERGNHAHKATEQVIVCIKGAFDLILDDGKARQTLRLSDPSTGIRLGAGLWHEMRSFTPDCVIIVFADRAYDESDSIRSYEEFLAFVKA